MQSLLLNIGFLLLTTCVGQLGFGQTLTIISDTNSPLPFATITNRTKHFIYSTAENGIAPFRAELGDTITISYVGYRTLTVPIKILRSQTITLNPDINSLPEVTISSCKPTKDTLFKNFENENYLKKFGGVSWSKVGSSAKVAVYVNPEKTGAVVKYFSFWIEKVPASPKHAIQTPLLISFYTVSNMDSLPDKALLTAPIIYYPKKYGKQTINLDTIKIRVPADGIFACFQYVMNEKYEWNQITKYGNGMDIEAVDTVITRYGGRIDGVFAPKSYLAFWDIKNDRWFSPQKPFSNDRRYGTIRYEAGIAYCKED